MSHIKSPLLEYDDYYQNSPALVARELYLDNLFMSHDI